MFVHAVYFWLKVESLRGCESVREMFIGVPAATSRPVIDRSYTFALVVMFDDLVGHDAYQEHPIHKAFVDTFGGYWTKLQIYDSN